MSEVEEKDDEERARIKRGMSVGSFKALVVGERFIESRREEKGKVIIIRNVEKMRV